MVGSEEQLAEVAHNSTKARWVPDETSSAAVPLTCVFVLDDSEAAVEVEPISPRQAVLDLIEASFHLPGSGSDVLQRHFDRIVRLAVLVPFYRLSYPYDFARLAEVAALVEATAAGALARAASGVATGAEPEPRPV